LKRVSDNQPDLILLDIMMPGMGGYQTCAEIKNNPQWVNIPVIFLTGNTSQESEEKAFAAGAIDFINKPIAPATVISRVHAHLGNNVS
jgi:putative two-component system response regulator